MDKDYSPSAMQTFDFCQTKWQLEREGWVPKIATRKLIAACWSTGAHAGFAEYGRLKLAGDDDKTHLHTCASHVAASEWLTEIDHYLKYGVCFGTLDIEERRQDLVKLVTKWCNTHLFGVGWELLAVELPLGEQENARPDVIAREPGGNLVVVDYKVKYEVNSKWFNIDEWVSEFAHDFKQIYYTQAVAQHYKQPCTRHYVYGVTAKPFDQVLTPFDVANLELHTRTGADLQSRMTFASQALLRGEQLPGHTTHRSVYGTCELLNACTLYRLNPEQMALEYVKVPRREKR